MFGFLGIYFLSIVAACAFPPAPYYTVYGDARDEFGYLIPAGGTTVVFYYGGAEFARYPISAVSDRDFNYEIRMKLDMNRAGTPVYNSDAVNSGTLYTLAIDIGGELYHPIEVTTAPKVGNPADRLRLNLTLGEDTDGDGLPDAWERMQLYYAGLDFNNLSLIGPNGDLDLDGLNNLQEYYAGTYATDGHDTFYLKMKEIAETEAIFEFFAITSKTYRLEKSADFVTWTATDFKTGTHTTATAAYTATGVGIVNGSVALAEGDSHMFYRLIVR